MNWQSPVIISAILAFVGGIYYLGKLLGGLQTKVEGIDMSLTEFKNDTKTEMSELRNLFASFVQTPVTRAQSPISLTEVGEDLAKYINADNLVNKYHDSVTIPDNVSAYEIQEICFNFTKNELFELLDPVEKSVVRKIAYDKGRTIQELMEIVGVKLRDYFLQEPERGSKGGQGFLTAS